MMPLPHKMDYSKKFLHIDSNMIVSVTHYFLKKKEKKLDACSPECLQPQILAEVLQGYLR